MCAAKLGLYKRSRFLSRSSTVPLGCVSILKGGTHSKQSMHSGRPRDKSRAKLRADALRWGCYHAIAHNGMSTSMRGLGSGQVSPPR